MGITMSGFSGIDTDSLITQLMAVEQQPITTMQNKQATYNQEISAWQAINTSLDTLKSKAEALLTDDVTSLDNIFDSLSTSSDDEDVVTATADADAKAGSYEIEVTQLAQAHRVASTQFTDSTSDLTLGASEFKISLANGDNFSVVLDGNESLSDVMDAINNAEGNDDGDGNQLVEASIVDNYLVIKSAETGESNELSFSDTTGTALQQLGIIDGTNTIQNTLQAAQNAELTIDGLAVTKESNEIDDVIAGVTLNLEGLSEADTSPSKHKSTTLTVSTDTEGIKKAVKDFVNQYNSVINKIDSYGGKEGLLQGDSTLSSLQSKLYTSVVYPSNTVSSTQYLSDNPLSGGGSLVINAADSANPTAAETVDLTADMTLDDIASEISKMDGITASVEDYRLVIESSDGNPVDLSGSSSLVLNNLELPESFDKNTASLLGVEINDDGTLSFNDDDFDDALDDNLSDLKQMFTGVDGIVDRLTGEIESAVDSFTVNGKTYDGYIEGRISSLNKQIDSLDDSIESLEDRLEMKEENLRAQFTAMETAISQMQNQGSWLTSMLGTSS